MVIGVCDKSSDLVKKNQDDNFNHFKLSNLDSILVNRNPSSDEELANKNYVDDSSSGKVLSFNQTPDTISKYLSEKIHFILLKMMKYKSEIQQKPNFQTSDQIYYKSGLKKKPKKQWFKGTKLFKINGDE